MSSINPEMLKQLLSEFEEKQAVCREEINAITDQIAELEQRIESSKERLTSVSRDREKIGQMKQRYQDGDWTSVLSQIKRDNNGHAEKVNATGDYPPVNVAAAPVESLVASPSPAPTPEPVVQETAPTPAPIPAPPTPDFTVTTPPESAPANPFETPPPLGAPQGQPPFAMDAPSWDPPQPYQEAPPPAPATPPAPAPSEGLFPFSQQQPAPDAGSGADIPWAPPPSMTWESVSHAFPNQGGAPDPAQAFPPQPAAPFPQPAAPAPTFTDPSQFVPQPQFQQPTPDAAQAQPPAFMAPPPAPAQPPNNAVLTTAFDEEFDISDALRGDDDNSQDSRDNDKKIKDALRGLFS